MRDEPEGLGLFCHTRFPAISNGRLVGGAFVAWGGARPVARSSPAGQGGTRVGGRVSGEGRKVRGQAPWARRPRMGRAFYPYRVRFELLEHPQFSEKVGCRHFPRGPTGHVDYGNRSVTGHPGRASLKRSEAGGKRQPSEAVSLCAARASGNGRDRWHRPDRCRWATARLRSGWQ